MTDAPVTNPERSSLEENRIDSQQKDNGANDLKITGYTFQLVIATYILGAATLLLGGAAVWQACLTRNAIKNEELFAEATRDSTHIADSIQRSFDAAQINISSEAMRKSLRAYLDIRMPYPEMMDGDSMKPFSIHIENNGQTPAYDVDCWASIAVETGEPKDFSKRMRSIHYASIRKTFVSDEDYFPLLFDSIPRFRKALQIKNGRRNIYVYGAVYYTDVASTSIRDTTEFCCFCKWLPLISRLSPFSVCQNGNRYR